MNLSNFTEIAAVDSFTKYEHSTDNVTAYEFNGYENNPVLYIRPLRGDKWMTMLYTNGSFTNMKANMGGFDRSLEDGKRMLRGFAQ